MSQVYGPYDAGYQASRCFWGESPASYLQRLFALEMDMRGWRVLDVGCGEGKNAVALADKGARVLAVDVSSAALKNAQSYWHRRTAVHFAQADVAALALPDATFELVIAYGLFHCLPSKEEVDAIVHRLKRTTKIGGYNVVCAFNDRRQDMGDAHPGFAPLLLKHDWYLTRYRDWETVCVEDSDLFETHPHNDVPHIHSLTRLLARRRGNR